MSEAIKALKVSAWPVLVGGAVLLFLTSGCNSSSRGFTGTLNSGSGQSQLPAGVPNNPYGSSFVSGMNNALASADSVSAADKQALRSYVGNAGDINPAQMDEAFDAQLKADLKKIQEAEKKGIDQMGQRLVVAQQAIEAMVAKLAPLWPKPGQPLKGEYGAILCGAAAKSTATTKPKETPKASEIRFLVTGDGYQKSANLVQYAIQGSIQGIGTTQMDGTMIVDAGDWNGYLADRENFAGKLLNQKYKQKPTGWDSCLIKPKLIRSQNPIPPNLAEYARQLGLQYKRILALSSPMMAAIFDGMEPALAQFLQMRMLGLN